MAPTGTSGPLPSTRNWPSSLENELSTVPASAFEAVDESSLEVSPDSGQARQPAVFGQLFVATGLPPG